MPPYMYPCNGIYFHRNMATSPLPNKTLQIHSIPVKALGTEFEVVYAEAGSPSGAVLIGIHGAPCTHNAFKGVVPPLVSAGYRVIIPNLPGEFMEHHPRGALKYWRLHA